MTSELKARIAKLENTYLEKRIGWVFQWVKTGVITQKEFEIISKKGLLSS